jgi:hypothetical protein
MFLAAAALVMGTSIAGSVVALAEGGSGICTNDVCWAPCDNLTLIENCVDIELVPVLFF